MVDILGLFKLFKAAKPNKEAVANHPILEEKQEEPQDIFESAEFLFKGTNYQSKYDYNTNKDLMYANALIRHFENFRDTPYKDGPSISVGYGFHYNNKFFRDRIPKEVWEGKRKLTKEEALALFDEYLNEYVKPEVRNTFKNRGIDFDSLTPAQKAVFYSLDYQLGQPGIAKRLDKALLKVGDDADDTAKLNAIFNEFKDDQFAKTYKSRWEPQNNILSAENPDEEAKKFIENILNKGGLP